MTPGRKIYVAIFWASFAHVAHWVGGFLRFWGVPANAFHVFRPLFFSIFDRCRPRCHVGAHLVVLATPPPFSPALAHSIATPDAIPSRPWTCDWDCVAIQPFLSISHPSRFHRLGSVPSHGGAEPTTQGVAGI